MVLRLDKLLSNMGLGSRKEVKLLFRKKRVTLNGAEVVNGRTHVNPSEDIVKVDGDVVHYRKYIYVMLNKPKGCVSATEDDRERTVIDLLPQYVKQFAPAPVGRLDKDTEGLLLLTNDGELNHYLTSPKHEVPKTYEAVIQGWVKEEHRTLFQKGVMLDDGYQTKSALLKIIDSDETSHVRITITEGKFHQVKRMFRAIDMDVLYLKRVQMGSLYLDESLGKGSYRELTEKELTVLKNV
ncbi:MAG TPA: pseudouridine synthase [Virgibacillus sp.]|nr:pseudouridine synthase [Virgibacillus sp.]